MAGNVKIWKFQEGKPAEFDVEKIAEVFAMPEVTEPRQLPSAEAKQTCVFCGVGSTWFVRYDERPTCHPCMAKTTSEQRRKTKPQPQSETEQLSLSDLRQDLEDLEHLPENEGVRFWLQAAISQLEREHVDEWPDVIGENQ